MAGRRLPLAESRYRRDVFYVDGRRLPQQTAATYRHYWIKKVT
jgi:hypothetical protein